MYLNLNLIWIIKQTFLHTFLARYARGLGVALQVLLELHAHIHCTGSGRITPTTNAHGNLSYALRAHNISIQTWHACASLVRIHWCVYMRIGRKYTFMRTHECIPEGFVVLFLCVFHLHKYKNVRHFPVSKADTFFWHIFPADDSIFSFRFSTCPPCGCYVFRTFWLARLWSFFFGCVMFCWHESIYGIFFLEFLIVLRRTQAKQTNVNI